MSAMLRDSSLVTPAPEVDTPQAANAKGSNALLAAQGTTPPAPPPGDGINPDQRAAGIQNAKRREVYDAHRATIPGTSFDLSKFGYATDRFTKIWTENRERYERVAAATGVPAELIAAIHFREGSGNFNTYLHNGQPLGQVTTIVPKGIFFTDWEEAAIDALKAKDSIRKDLNMTAETQDLAAIATFGESYNGLGYHNRGKESPYVYSGSSAYSSGKYVADGVYDPNTRDQQLGVLAMVQMARGQVDKTGKATTSAGPMADGNAPAAGGSAAKPAPATKGPAAKPASQAKTTGDATRGSINMGERYLSLGDFGKDVTAVQRALNRLGYPIAIDGEFGPETDHAVRSFQRGHGLEVDGTIGPSSRATILAELKGGAPTTPAKPGAQTGGQTGGPDAQKDSPEGAPGPGPDTTTEAKLATFFKNFNGIPIQVNPGEDPPKYVDVIPPYHINAGFRKDGAARERTGNRAVNEVINGLPVNARYGKATTGDIQSFLNTCIQRGLVPDTSAKGMRDFLAKYGISTDCSGLVSQALNYLADGNMQVDKSDPLNPMNTGSGSLKGGAGQFDKVTSPRSLEAGVTMHIPGHIRILIEVDHQGQGVVFRTAESTPREDVVEEDQRDAKGQRKADGGVGDVHWRYLSADKFESLQRSADGGKTWAASSERPTYGRFQKLAG